MVFFKTSLLCPSGLASWGSPMTAITTPFETLFSLCQRFQHDEAPFWINLIQMWRVHKLHHVELLLPVYRPRRAPHNAHNLALLEAAVHVSVIQSDLLAFGTVKKYLTLLLMSHSFRTQPFGFCCFRVSVGTNYICWILSSTALGLKNFSMAQ